MQPKEYRMQLHQPGLVDVFSGKERCKAILDEVDRMPENWQKVAELKLIEGRPTSEVCDQLSISEKACYSRVSRIRKYIKSLLKREDWALDRTMFSRNKGKSVAGHAMHEQ